MIAVDAGLFPRPEGQRTKTAARVSRLYEVMDLMLDSVGDPWH